MPNSFVGFAPLDKVGNGIVFVAMGKATFGNLAVTLDSGNGHVQQFYNAAKASGIPEISGATPSNGLAAINLAMLDSGDTSCALIHKTPLNTNQTVFRGLKHTGLPYYTNTFLMFQARKPRLLSGTNSTP